MPCYSNIKTVLLDIVDIEEAAKSLGIKVERHNANRYTLRKGSEYITITRESVSSAFETVAYSGSGRWDTEILEPLLPAYAKIRLKKFAKQKGYSLTADANKQGAYVLTSFK